MRRVFLSWIAVACISAPAGARALDDATLCREAAPYREEAERALADGRLADAMRELGEVVARCPQDAESRAQLAEVRERVLAQEEQEHRRTPPDAVLTPEALFGAARTELRVFQTAHGGMLGGVAGFTFSGGLSSVRSGRPLEVPQVGATVVGMVLVGSVGYALASRFDPRGLTTGQEMAINSGTLWGLWAATPLLTERVRGGPSLLPLGPVVGTVAGGLLGTAFRPRPGHVALANSVGLWSGCLAALTAHALQPGLALHRTVRVALPASALGLAAGMGVGIALHVGRLRMALINLGGLGGLLLSGGVALATGSSLQQSSTLLPLVAGSGALGGLTLTALLTQGLEREHDPPLTLVPVMSTRGMGVGIAGVL